MLGKSFILLAVLLSAAAGEDFVDMLTRIKDSRRGFEGENPCEGNVGTGFVRNNRGCSWFWQCSDENIVRQDRCPGEYHFNPTNQMCDFRDSANCDINNEQNYVCPPGRVVTVIPHPYSCEFIFSCEYQQIANQIDFLLTRLDVYRWFENFYILEHSRMS